MPRDPSNTKGQIDSAHEAVQVAVGRWLANEGILDTLPDHKKAELILKITKESFLSQDLEEQVTHLISMLEGGQRWVQASKEMAALKLSLDQMKLQFSMLNEMHENLVSYIKVQEFDLGLFWSVLKESVEDLTQFNLDTSAVLEYLECNEQEFKAQLKEIRGKGNV